MGSGIPFSDRQAERRADHPADGRCLPGMGRAETARQDAGPVRSEQGGKFGLLQPLADLIKLVTKEDTVPEEANKGIFLLAPGVVSFMALLIFAVIPFGRNIASGADRSLWSLQTLISACSSSWLFLPSVSTGSHWADGPPTQNIAFLEEFAVRLR